LVIRPDHLGDLLCATPALACLRQQRPDAHITAMVGPWGEPALAANPDIDALLTCPFPGFTRQPKSSAWAPYRVLAEYARQLRPLRFDAAIILRGDHWWGALLAAWADIPTRLGYDIAETRPFLTDVQAYVPGRHEVIQNLCLIDPDLAATTPDQWPSRFPLAVEDERWAVQLAASIGDPTAPLVAIHPGAGAPVKTWCTAAWAHVADALVEGRNARIVITGGASEHDLAESVAREMRHPASILAGQTSLGQLGALLGRCALVIGPDCGPLHLAVAVGAPTIHLFGPADARLFGPWGDPQQHRVLTSDWACIPCNRLDYPAAVLSEHGCVRDIDEESVWDAALEFLL
jgi:heptosyltransferase-2/heptosyltransferase-3